MAKDDAYMPVDEVCATLCQLVKVDKTQKAGMSRSGRYGSSIQKASR